MPYDAKHVARVQTESHIFDCGENRLAILLFEFAYGILLQSDVLDVADGV
jgi:hypothetical protein